MVKMTLGVEGMMCDMCAAHINDAIRRAFDVKKVTSSHKKGETVIIAENELPQSKIAEVIGATGYTVLSIQTEPYSKKGLFGIGK